MAVETVTNITAETIDAAHEEALFEAMVRELLDDSDLLQDAWDFYSESMFGVAKGTPQCGSKECRTCEGSKPQDFVILTNEILSEIDGDAVELCVVCKRPEWQDNLGHDGEGLTVCDTCRDDHTTCGVCTEYYVSQRRMIVIGEDFYCESCRDDHCGYCDTCDTYYHNDFSDEHDHQDGCDCAPHDLHFQILANSHGVLHEDERLLVELPKGHISDEALSQVALSLWNAQLRASYVGSALENPTYSTVFETVLSLDPVWQTKGGNFTKRLSKVLYQNHNIKLGPGLLSKVGAQVRDHVGDSTNSWNVEFTRDLNQPPGAFYNDGSCWWGSEAKSLCALKHWGGFAMRSYSDNSLPTHQPTGRAWIQPLNGDLQPTLDIHGAPAYIIYNGYGELEGYTPARLLAYLTSRTYKKIDLDITYQYINCGGYLVADQETCEEATLIAINNLNYHTKVAA